MKLYICVNQQPLNGYKNIDLARERVDFQNPDSVCERSACTEIIVDGALSYLNLQSIPSFLQILISRLRKGGKIVINDYDAVSVLQKYANGLLSIADLNFVLFGNNQPTKNACISHKDLHDILTGAGLEIKSVELLDLNFSLIAKRV